MKKAASLLLLFLMPLLAFGQQSDVPLEVKGGDVKVVKVDKVVIVKEDLTVVNSFPFTVHAPLGAGLYFWQIPSGVSALDKGEVLEVTAAPKGRITIGVKLISADWDAKKFVTKFGQASFAIGGIEPPIPPIPPDPPKPPEPPVPPPSPSPITVPEGGMRVMIVYETSQALPSAQQVILTSSQVHGYLKSKTTPTGDFGKRGWYIVDKDTDFSGESRVWQEAIARASGKTMPWILIGTSKGGFEGSLPADVPATLELLKKFGG